MGVMNRFWATLILDVRIQMRNGFYLAALLVSIFVVLALRQLPPGALARLLPLALMQNLTISVFYFIGALALLEKSQGVLQALAVTPLRRDEYLLAKIVSLGGLALAESWLATVLTYGLGLNWAAWLAAMLAMIMGMALLGFVIVLGYDSVNEYLPPSVGWVLLLSLPLVDYLGLWRSPWFYLHPFQAPLTLLRGLFAPLAPWEWVYGVIYAALWLAILFVIARRRFASYQSDSSRV